VPATQGRGFLAFTTCVKWRWLVKKQRSRSDTGDASLSGQSCLNMSTSNASRVIANLLNRVESLKKQKAGLMAPICVTGGSGFLASWVVKMLLEKGYVVHATTRRAEKAAFLKDMSGAENNLRIFAGCDFSVENSFDEAIDGCRAVIHCASPFFNAGGTRENLVEPAVAGTEMVLNACRKFSVEQVTLTSSSASVIVDYGSKADASASGNYVYTEADFSPEDVLEAKSNWYCLSKLMAEKRAWELSKEPGCPYKLCVLNPSLIWGPMTPGQTHLNTSSAAITQYMDGTHKKFQNGVRCVVDARERRLGQALPSLRRCTSLQGDRRPRP
jgi:nucleoside-diphosphate-sugar epimerase